MLRKLCSVALTQTRGAKTEVKIKWIRPEYIPSYKPKKSGDLEPAPSIKPDSIAYEYKHCDELKKDCPDVVKALFTVGYMSKSEANNLARRELLERVKRHQYDSTSAEARIALLTGRIRCLQDHMGKFSGDRVNKVTLQHLIDKRKKLLKYMRGYDYKRFEWLIEQLNIEYKGFPESYHNITRKEALRKLTEMHCDSVKKAKLDEYRNLLESQQGPFLKDKLEALKTIRSEQKDLGLQVTITDKDIQIVETMLEKWKTKDELKCRINSSKSASKVITTLEN